MKKLIPAYIIAFATSFMLFIYEPITMYANNTDDFWFDIYTIIFPVIIILLLSTLLLSIFYTIIYLLTNKLLHKNNIYYIIMIASFIIFFASYIQGNYLIGNLPRLNGAKVDWTKFTTQNIITVIIWITIIITYIIAIIKLKFEKVINISKYIVLAVCGMLTISLITTICTTNIFVKKDIIGITTENLYTYSNKKNFIILLLDAVDSRTFNEVIENSDYKDTFEDFTYYQDTLGAYPFTRDSIPFILTGQWNENKTDFMEYYNSAIKKSKLFEKLKEKNYNMSIYETDFKIDDENNDFSNVKKMNNAGISTTNLLKQEIKYVLFKYLPYNLKKYSKIETLEFIQGSNPSEFFRNGNLENYENIRKMNPEIKEERIFKFIHLDGAHEPFNLDENMNTIAEGTYEQKVESTLNLTNKYFEKLKENQVYDNSIIIVLADHGYNGGNTKGRQNPILYIKGFNEHHQMYTSDKPISFEDLQDTYIELLNGKKSNELFLNISKNRTRRYLSYEYAKENNMIEYETKGKAWDTDAMYKTGKEFNR